MIQHNLSTYQIESMQPNWLVEGPQRRLYKLYFCWFLGMFFGLVAGLLLIVLGEPSLGLVTAFILGPAWGLIIGRFDNSMNELIYGVTMVDRLKWSWRGALSGLRYGLEFGLFFGAICGLIVGLAFGPTWGLITGLPMLLVPGVTGALLGGLSPEQIEETTYPGQRLKQTLTTSLISALSHGLYFGSWFGLVAGLFSGFGVDHPFVFETGEIFRLETALKYGLFGLVVGLIIGLIFALVGDLARSGTDSANRIGRLSGLWGKRAMSGLMDQPIGFIALMKHYSLRWVLAKHHLLPRQLMPFLEYSVSLIFLRRVGGSYIFVHRLLMEHFAEMEV